MGQHARVVTHCILGLFQQLSNATAPALTSMMMGLIHNVLCAVPIAFLVPPFPLIALLVSLPRQPTEV